MEEKRSFKNKPIWNVRTSFIKRSCNSRYYANTFISYDNQNNRLGYGGGFYDRYLNKYLKTYSNILTIGIAFSFQKHHKIPVLNNDVKIELYFNGERYL